MKTYKMLTYGPKDNDNSVDTFNNRVIDETLLEQGIYFTNTPVLHHSSITIEKLIALYLSIHGLTKENFWCENLRKCRLVEVFAVPTHLFDPSEE